MPRKPLAHPELVTVAKRVPQGVLCPISTLSFHELTTQLLRSHSVDPCTAEMTFLLGVHQIGAASVT